MFIPDPQNRIQGTENQTSKKVLGSRKYMTLGKEEQASIPVLMVSQPLPNYSAHPLAEAPHRSTHVNSMRIRENWMRIERRGGQEIMANLSIDYI